jgi:hypothetical protein
MAIMSAIECVRFYLPDGFASITIYDMQGRIAAKVPLIGNKSFGQRAVIGAFRQSKRNDEKALVKLRKNRCIPMAPRSPIV